MIHDQSPQHYKKRIRFVIKTSEILDSVKGNTQLKPFETIIESAGQNTVSQNRIAFGIRTSCNPNSCREILHFHEKSN